QRHRRRRLGSLEALADRLQDQRDVAPGQGAGVPVLRAVVVRPVGQGPAHTAHRAPARPAHLVPRPRLDAAAGPAASAAASDRGPVAVLTGPGGRPSSGRPWVLPPALPCALGAGHPAALVASHGALAPRGPPPPALPLAQLLWLRAGTPEARRNSSSSARRVP